MFAEDISGMLSPSSSSSSQASANSSARLPRPFPAAVTPFESSGKPKSKLPPCEDLGRGVKGGSVDCRDDFRLLLYGLVGLQTLTCGLFENAGKSLIEEVRLCRGVRGEEGMGMMAMRDGAGFDLGVKMFSAIYRND